VANVKIKKLIDYAMILILKGDFAEDFGNIIKVVMYLLHYYCNFVPAFFIFHFFIKQHRNSVKYYLDYLSTNF
jgi:hypothetical protein